MFRSSQDISSIPVIDRYFPSFMKVNSEQYADMQRILMEELRLMHYPIAVKFFFDVDELAEFQTNAEHYRPAKPMSFCQWEIAARMKGQTVLGEKKQLGCKNAAFGFGWRSLNPAEIQSHAKYTRDLEQAERFVRSKSRLPEGEVLAIAVSPPGCHLLCPGYRSLLCGQYAGVSPRGGLHGRAGCPSAAASNDHELLCLWGQRLYLPGKDV